ncbi:hypothetical protein PTQ27_10315 [Mannheimia sp. AT1]|uniref:Uncharacterized protein n=1 Tax=Mannheimia cairinae TaxID=3025936 RepID=A0ABT5MRP2_9PAST|nr:hypothetical protein [Mannheimia cairinae]MDD0824851.1 hypothetical protein [Mannheimia cairinae]MDD0826219.1 hypothetical protein [Mannheimia cairinae]
MTNQLSSKKASCKVIPEQISFSSSLPVYIPLFFADKTKKIQSVWELELENGERDAGPVKRNRIQFSRLPVGSHKLTVIIGKPLLGNGTKIYQCLLNIEP